MTLFVIILIVLLLGGVSTGPYWGYSRGWGWGPSGIIWFLFIIVLIYLLMGRGLPA